MTRVERALWALCTALGVLLMAPATFIVLLSVTGSSVWINGVWALLTVGGAALIGASLVFVALRRLLA